MHEGIDEENDDQEAVIGLDDALVAEVRRALDDDEPDLAAGLTAALHVADLADLFELIDSPQRIRLIGILDEGAIDPLFLTYLDETVREEIVREIGPRKAAVMISELEDDDAIEILEDLDEESQLAILRTLPLPERELLEQGLAFPPETAGRLMQRDLVAVPEYWTVGQTIDYLRSSPELPDDFYDLYIIDPRFRVVGSIPLSLVLRNRRNVLLNDLSIRELRTVTAMTAQEEVGYLFSQYGLSSAPVVDDEGKLLGVITFDDVVDVIQEEAEDDILKLGGVSESDVFATAWQTVRGRLPWLCVNLLTAIAASLVIAQFEDSIEAIVALAVLMPIVASMGGNAGTQSLTIAVRSLAVKELTGANAPRQLFKEFAVGAANGLAFFAIGVGLALFWFGDVELALVFGAAMIITLVIAGVSGIAIPFIIDRLGLDPAVSSTVFLTTVTDVVGFFAFLGLAALFLF
jgi:magnesium transporter